MSTPGDRAAAGGASPSRRWVREVSTRELIATLAASEDELRDPACDPSRRRDLAQTQAVIVHELQLRKDRRARRAP